MSPDPVSRSAPRRPRFELADLVREQEEALRAQQAVSAEEDKVLRALRACRTAALGGHLERCLECGHERPAYNSCRNRHCPKCQALAQERWLLARQKTLLPIAYFHVVFTLPGELSGVVLCNRRLLLGLLLRAAAETLLTLGRDPDRLGAQLGLTLVLHTWTRDLRLHPHVHAIVTGGGLSLDGERWVAGDARYLFPVQVLARLFRGKMLDAVLRRHQQGELQLPEELRSPRRFAKWRRRLYQTNWVTYAKAPFAGPQQILGYLGRYTHRVALSNPRLLEVTPRRVVLRTRARQSVTLEPVELLRRFLLHLLPSGFVRIRHYGLHATRNLKTQLSTARRLLGVEPGDDPPAIPARDEGNPQDAQADDTSPPPEPPWRVLLRALLGRDPARCPVCASPAWIHLPLEASPPIRPPPQKEEA